uniref:Cytochrome b-c1 complex subunit 9 n=1 Tax=Setaria digitata TaxID=48799 RepID=A0A915PI11_9BILA
MIQGGIMGISLTGTKLKAKWIFCCDCLMAFARYAYRLITKRFSTLFLALTVGAIAADLAIDKGGDYLFDRYNEGKLWKDIKDKYVDDMAFTG